MCENLPRRGRLGFLLEGTLLVRHARASKLISGFQSYWHLLVFWRGHGLPSRSDTDLARLLSRSSVGVERTGIPPARPLRERAGVAFLVLGAVLVVAGRGWFLRRSWGWGLTAVLVASQTVGSAVNAILGDFWEGAIGSILAGAILYFLLRPQVRTAFRRRASLERRVV
jgi:hypothetical protein